MYASPQQIGKNETVSLAGIHALQNSILVLVDTTVPLVKRAQSERTGSKQIIVDDSDSEDVDSLGPVSVQSFPHVDKAVEMTKFYH